MSLSETLEKEYIEAYKAKQSIKVGVLRMIKTAAKNKLVELKRVGGVLDDGEMLDVILRQAKQREDAIEQYNLANRQDLAKKEMEELEIVRLYLPKQLNKDELCKIIDETIVSLGAKTSQDMGKVIGSVMQACKGQADGKEVSAMVKSRLVKK